MKKVAISIIVTAIIFAIPIPGSIQAVKAQTINLKLAHFMSPIHIQHQNSFVPFTKKVEELSGGRVKIKIFSGGSLGGPKQLAEAVKTNITDIAFVIPSYTTGRFSRISAIGLPYLFDSGVHATKVMYDIYDQYLADDFKDYKVLWLYSSGVSQLLSVTRPVRSVEDLIGMKIRSPTATMTKALKLLGANPVGMPISKLVMSLQKKVIDGSVGAYSNIADFRLMDLIKYVTEVKIYTTPMSVLMNKQKFNSLPDFARQAIDKASGKQAGFHASTVYDEHDNNVLKKIKGQNKIEIIKLSTEGKSQFMKPVMKKMEIGWIEDVSKKGLPAKEILNAVKASAKKLR